MTPPTVRYLVLLLTTACNARCAYCYRGDEPAQVMSEVVAYAALRMAARSGLPFHVQLAGGEPTLAPDMLAYVGRIVREAGWPATIAVQTNGTRVDDALIEMCRQYAIDIGISLDGPLAVQEQLRGQAAATFHGLTRLAAAQVPVRVTTVLSSANVQQLDALVMTLALFDNVTGFGFDALVRRGRAAHGDALMPNAAAIAHGVRVTYAAWSDVTARRQAPLRWREFELVRTALQRRDESARPYCHACQGESLAIHPDGTAYPCAQTVGDPDYAVGTVDAVDWQRLRQIYQGIDLTGPCTECAVSGRCPGDCPSRLAYNAGREATMCMVYRTIADILLKEHVG